MFNCPLSLEKANRLIEQLSLVGNCHVIDVGCGEGEFLIRVAERYRITGIGLDNNSGCIERANEKAKARLRGKDVSFICRDAQSCTWETYKSNLMICIGAEFIFGGYRQTLQYLSQSLIEDGKLLIGTVFWKQVPVPEYLSLMGGKNPHFDYLTTIEIAFESGFIPLYLCRSNEDEWDDFESQHAQKHYLAALQNSDEKAFERARSWQGGYLKWGYETMGFGFFLLQKRSGVRAVSEYQSN